MRPPNLATVIVHLVDGTYELFRHFFAVPSHVTATGEEVAAARGVVASMLRMIIAGTTHLGVATDHVIESFRNDLFDGYKRGDGIEPTLRAQFEPLEDALRAFGITVWAEVELEADDALASAAAVAAADARVQRVMICTPDKDLSQSVVDRRVLQLDRRRDEVRDEAGVVAKFGVQPKQIPAYLALVGDTADGIPGLPGFGPKAAAALLSEFGTLAAIPDDPSAWPSAVRGAPRLAAILADRRDDLQLYELLATLRTDGTVGVVDEWAWQGVEPEAATWAARFEDPGLLALAESAEAALAGR